MWNSNTKKLNPSDRSSYFGDMATILEVDTSRKEPVKIVLDKHANNTFWVRVDDLSDHCVSGTLIGRRISIKHNFGARVSREVLAQPIVTEKQDIQKQGMFVSHMPPFLKKIFAIPSPKYSEEMPKEIFKPPPAEGPKKLDGNDFC